MRHEQIEVFETAQAHHFALRMERHLKDAFPKHCGFLGNDGIHEVIDYGIRQGKIYGLTQQSSVRLFTDLTLLLGRFFHADVQMPWATEILTKEQVADELTKAQRLHTAAMAYLNGVSGPKNEFIDEAQRRLIREPIAIRTGSRGRFTTEVLQRLDHIWPEKYSFVGESIISRVIQEGFAKSAGVNIHSESGVLVYVVMMYMLGSGFYDDPLFAWARTAINGEDAGAPADPTERLHQAGIDYLKQWCA